MGNILAVDNKVNHNLSLPIQSYIFKSLRKGDQVRFKVVGKSMRPLIELGDWVCVQPYSNLNQPKIGDIVLIKKLETFLVHRIIQMNEVFFITQGDCSRTIDPPNQSDDILGKVVLIEKRRFNAALSNPIIQIIDQTIFKSMKIIKICFRKGKINGNIQYPDQK